MDLKPFRNDEDASLLALFAEKNNCDDEIYTEPKSSMGEKTYMERLIENQKGHESVEEGVEESESSEDSLDGIDLEDNEEEIMNDFDEDLGEGLSIRVDKGEPRRENVGGVGISQVTNRVFTIVEMDRDMS